MMLERELEELEEDQDFEYVFENNSDEEVDRTKKISKLDAKKSIIKKKKMKLELEDEEELEEVYN